MTDTRASADLAGKFPLAVALSEQQTLQIELMGAEHADAVLRFAQALPPEDLLFLRVDITRPETIDNWIAELDGGLVTTLLAVDDGAVAGYATLQRTPARWTRRVGEIRVNAGPDYRGIGLGRTLMAQIFDLARGYGLKKLMANMTMDQRDAQTAFRRLGFVPEAVLADFVEDRDGGLRDLVIMTYDVDGLTTDAGRPLRV